MIELITGLPGNGKTLYTIAYVKDWSDRDNRPVYYSGIKDLNLPWTEIDPEKWYDCPTNSIIVIDECQRVFRPRSMGKEPPEHVSRLETHRHQGVDIVLITQHPMLADSAIRRLVGKHKHVVRTFGTQRATIHEWASVKDNCDKSSGRADSIKHLWKYPKEVFDWYKSAEAHTVKRNIPAKIWILASVPFILIALGLVLKNYITKSQNKVAIEQASSPDKAAPGQMKTNEIGKAQSYKNALEDVKQYAYVNTERVEGLPHTAPKYDELTQPTVAPIPAGCVQSASTGCRCFTQQATPIKMPEKMCMDIVKNGWFEDFDTAGKSKRKEETQRQAHAKESPNHIDTEQKSQVVAFGHDKQERQTSKASQPEAKGPKL